jgi:hypothetical protein
MGVFPLLGMAESYRLCKRTAQQMMCNVFGVPLNVGFWDTA